MSNYLQDSSVRQMIAVEKSVVEFETILENLYDVLSQEVLKDLKYFYQMHQKDGKVFFAQLRKNLPPKEHKQLLALLDAWMVQFPSGDFTEFHEYMYSLYESGHITYLDQLCVTAWHSVFDTLQQEMSLVLPLALLIIKAAYGMQSYSTARHFSGGVRIKPLTQDKAKAILHSRWDDSRNNSNLQERLIANSELLAQELARAIPKAIAAGANFNIMTRDINKRISVGKNRHISTIRTEMNRLNAQSSLAFYELAELDQYQYIAILDEVTSLECRYLAFRIFDIDQAREGVNLPPMHTHCRSSIVAVIPDGYDVSEAISLSRTDSIEAILGYAIEEEDLQEVKDFIEKYY